MIRRRLSQKLIHTPREFYLTARNLETGTEYLSIEETRNSLAEEIVRRHSGEPYWKKRKAKVRFVCTIGSLFLVVRFPLELRIPRVLRGRMKTYNKFEHGLFLKTVLQK
jgi:hypothetical protein